MTARRVPLALVHHANQYLITDGYDNREGLTDILDRLTDFLALHERMAIPLNLHISGTLLEAILWARPRFLERIRRLRLRGLLMLIGGAYGQNIMPVSSPGQNRRQLRELLRLYERHLDCPPDAVKFFWLPERVWDTDALAPILADQALPNGGYRVVLLDDRTVYSDDGNYARSDRARFDASGPADILPWVDSKHNRVWAPESARAYRIDHGHGLAVLPICAGLRYAVPPSREGHWNYLESLATEADRLDRPETILIYADDIEKAAGLAGWDPRGLSQYEAFLTWLKDHPQLDATLLSEWLSSASLQLPHRQIDPGTFFELARLWRAGEDYLGWWQRRGWRRHRAYFDAAEKALRNAEESGADERLLELGWKHFLASSYEEGWHHETADTAAPQPWAKALASHARASLVIAEAARWQSERDAACHVESIDLDRDGERELVLKHDDIFAVFSPSHGGRLTYLFDQQDDGGQIVVGNPSDDWNWQEDLNRYMDQPPNHPGALTDVGFEHDVYTVESRSEDTQMVLAELRNTTSGSALEGSRKCLALLAGDRGLVVCYQLTERRRLSVDSCLSPDYLELLRNGRHGVRSIGGTYWRGWQNGSTRVWVAIDQAEGIDWDVPQHAEAGHGFNVRVTAHASHFHLQIGTRRPSASRLRKSVALLHAVR